MPKYAFILALSVLVFPSTNAFGQATRRTGYVNPYNTCRGFSALQMRSSVGADGRSDLRGFPVVAGVDSLSPAGLAGLRNGDSLVAMNGVPTLGGRGPGTVAYRHAPGDTNVLRVRNTAGEHDITFVVGEWIRSGRDSLCRAAKHDRDD